MEKNVDRDKYRNTWQREVISIMITNEPYIEFKLSTGKAVLDKLMR